MKGLELCKLFFFQEGLPRIKETAPEVLPYLAAGLGGGSQCHGNDDEVSRDHGWGPGFAIWLPKEIKSSYIENLRIALELLPKQYLGYGWSNPEEAKYSCPILNNDEFMMVKIGVTYAPVSDTEWLNISEEKLFEITHYPIFYDEFGEMSNRFDSFKKYYSEDVWKKRLASHLQEAWKWDVQYVKRSVKRGDIISASLLWGRYVEHIMKVVFLLNHRYAPYEKWLYREFLKLPLFGQQVGEIISRGVHHPADISKLTEDIEKIIIEELENLSFKPVNIPDAAYPKSTLKLLEYSMGVLDAIKNPDLKN
ncbi:DUF4037 domain-containing protein [Paenibacillus aurantiacus]|uniref:DUF4037 domain-containing protein n=1 Tax=Paenibacillus aurantiacus TaxID=1936118 RepID=A0ABV5KPC9_9BACL